MSFFFLPYAATSAELSTDYTERSVLFAYRTFFNCVGNVFLLVLGYWVFMHGREGPASIAAPMPDSAGRSAPSPSSQPSPRPTAPGRSATDCASRRWPTASAPASSRRKSPKWRAIARSGACFSCCLLFWISMGMGGNAGIHANLYFWRLPQDVIATLPLVNIAGFAVAVPLSTWLLRWFEKRDVALIGFALMSRRAGAARAANIAGPPAPAARPLYDILGVITFLSGMAGTCGFVSCGSMMSDAVDEHELLFGARREGLFFAGLLFSVKAATGIGGFLSGLALDLIHFPKDIAESGANIAIAPQVATNLGLVQGPLPAALGVAGAIVLLGYRITRSELARIQHAIAQANPAIR